MDEPFSVTNSHENDLNNFNFTNVITITFDTKAVNENVLTKAYVARTHNVIERNRRDLGFDMYDESSDLVKNNQDKDFNDRKLTNLDSNRVNRDASSDDELANKKYVDDSIRDGKFLRFSQTLQNYLKASVGNDVYILAK